MTALTAPRATPTLETGANYWRTFGVAADEVINPGALVAINDAGYLEEGTTATDLRCVGIAVPKRQQMVGGVVNATSLAAGVATCEVQSCIALMVNGSTSITLADVGNDCYIVDDQTVHRTNGSTAGTAQVTRGDVQFSTTDQVGVTVDGLTIDVASDTSDDITLAALVAKWNAHPVAKLLATATADTSGDESWFILTFLDTAVHVVVQYSPDTAGVATITNTTAAVAATAATRSRAGKIWDVDTRGVWVACGLPS